ncbi:MAG: glycosyltransferase [Bacteroidota bacterium]
MPEQSPDNGSIIIAGFRHPMPGAFFAYDLLMPFLSENPADADSLPFSGKQIHTFGRRINMSLFEISLWKRARKGDLIHYLFPEQHYVLGEGLSDKIIKVATLHRNLQAYLPENARNLRLKALASRRLAALKKFDGIIIHNSEEAEDFRKLFPKAKVKFILPGIHSNAAYLKPVTAGHSRHIYTYADKDTDIHTWKDVVQAAAGIFPDWVFKTGGNRRIAEEMIEGCENAAFAKAEDYESLMTVFGKADIHFMPALHAGPSSPMLAAHSCGVPTLASDIQGVRDYATATTRTFSTAREALVLLEQELKFEAHKRNNVKQNTLISAMDFYFEETARHYFEFYEELFADRTKK